MLQWPVLTVDVVVGQQPGRGPALSASCSMPLTFRDQKFGQKAVDHVHETLNVELKRKYVTPDIAHKARQHFGGVV